MSKVTEPAEPIGDGPSLEPSELGSKSVVEEGIAQSPNIGTLERPHLPDPAVASKATNLSEEVAEANARDIEREALVPKAKAKKAK